MAAKPLAINDDNFNDEVLQSSIPVVVDFWASWCAPCKRIAPILEELAADYDGKAKICKIDVDHNRDIAGHYGIRSIPTLLFFKNGELTEQLIGALPKEQIAEKIESLIV